MGRYAAQTEVPVTKTRAEIEETVQRYGASSFSTGWSAESHMIQFVIDDWVVRFILPLPKKDDQRFTHKKDNRTNRLKKLSDVQTEKVYDQEVRSRWRALLLVIKAKLEAVECEISTIEQEFLSFIVMPNQVTVGQWFVDTAMASLRAGEMPRLMLSAPKKDDAVDAEIVEK